MANQALSLISHELKSPVIAINGALSALRLLGGRLDTAAAHELLHAAELESRYLSAFLEALICVAHLRAEPAAYVLSRQDAAAVLAARVRRLQDGGLNVNVRQPAGSARALLHADVLGITVDWLCNYLIRKIGPDAALALVIRETGVEISVVAPVNETIRAEMEEGLQAGLKRAVLDTLLAAQKLRFTGLSPSFGWRLEFPADAI